MQSSVESKGTILPFFLEGESVLLPCCVTQVGDCFVSSFAGTEGAAAPKAAKSGSFLSTTFFSASSSESSRVKAPSGPRIGKGDVLLSVSEGLL